jgi:hypothetical protein
MLSLLDSEKQNNEAHCDGLNDELNHNWGNLYQIVESGVD